MSKYKCICGFDGGSDEACSDHMWDEYLKLKRQAREENWPNTKLNEAKKAHFASWLNDTS